MKILITSGGTCEDIDSVRGITNKSTGRLGSVIADIFAGACFDVTYISGETAVLPLSENVEIVKIRGVVELLATLEMFLYERKYDVVVHGMAVSDFTPTSIICIDDIVKNITALFAKTEKPCGEMDDKIRKVIFDSEKPLTEKKISSNEENIALLLKQTPKVIERIKTIQPDALLVGFKLLSDVTEEELIKSGQNLLKKNSCDFVLINDLKDINENVHKGILLDKKGVLDRAATKTEIGKMIFRYVSERMKKNENNNTRS